MKISLAISVITIFLLSSCESPRYIYAVTPQNLPSLKKKGDFQADAFYSTNGTTSYVDDTESSHYSNGIDGNAAVAITNHLAITGSLGYRWEKNQYDGYYDGISNLSAAGVKYYRMNWEVGTGYYSSIHRQDKVFFQIFGGVGTGRYSIDDKGFLYDPNTGSSASYTRFHNSNVFRFYLHPAVHFYFNEYFSMAVAGKMTNIHYSDIRTDYSLVEQQNYRLQDLDGKTFTMFEPCIDLKLRIPGAEWIAPHMQFTFSTYLQSYDTRKANASFGITIMTPKRKND